MLFFNFFLHVFSVFYPKTPPFLSSKHTFFRKKIPTMYATKKKHPYHVRVLNKRANHVRVLRKMAIPCTSRTKHFFKRANSRFCFLSKK